MAYRTARRMCLAALERVILAVAATLVASLVSMRQFLARRDLLTAQSEFSYQALHDALTGLPCGVSARREGRAACGRSREGSGPWVGWRALQNLVSASGEVVMEAFAKSAHSLIFRNVPAFGGNSVSRPSPEQVS